MSAKIVFFGDSITAASRNDLRPLGEGYVSILADLFKSDSRLAHWEVINSGINGNTVKDLLNRYGQDVIAYRPDVVVINIGINDAYLDFIEPVDGGEIRMYQSGLQGLIRDLTQALSHSKLVLFTPYLIVNSRSDEFYQKMTTYGEAVKTLGAHQGIPVFDVQAVFDEAVKTTPAEAWADDQIHPHREGHDLIAKAAFDFLQRNLFQP